MVLYTGAVHWCRTLVPYTGAVHWCCTLVLYTGAVHWCCTLVSAPHLPAGSDEVVCGACLQVGQLTAQCWRPISAGGPDGLHPALARG